MSSLFRAEGAAAGPPSVVDDDGVAGGRDSEIGGVRGMQNLEREDGAANVLKGRNRNKCDPRLYRYDAIRGRGENLPFEVTKDSIMPALDAGDKLHQLHKLFGLEFETEGVLHAFDSALWFCHTLNSGSSLTPGRATFTVPGVTKTFSYAEVREALGVDMRRFFRAFADDITQVNRAVLRDYDPADPVKKEMHGWLTSVAYERGLSRYPWLAHDSADSCNELSPTERQALRQSKALAVGGTPNAADRLKPTQGIQSADKYDSTVGENY